MSRLLRSWSVPASLPPGFAADVRRRLASKPPSSIQGAWLRFALDVLGRLRQPRFAIAYVSGLILLGAVSGSWHAQETSTSDSTDLQSRYLASIDPYQMPRSHPNP